MSGCLADQIDVNIECELQEGHEGDHVCTFTWPQRSPVAAAFEAAVILGVGYRAYLASKYGAEASR